jgi:hypothetical protein
LAIDRFDDGAPEWLASPLCDSYHTVWMRLHQELLLVPGITAAGGTRPGDTVDGGRAQGGADVQVGEPLTDQRVVGAAEGAGEREYVREGAALAAASAAICGSRDTGCTGRAGHARLRLLELLGPGPRTRPAKRNWSQG